MEKEEKYEQVIEEFKNDVHRMAQEIFNDRKECDPIVCALMIIDNEPKKCILQGFEVFFKDEESKELLAEAIHKLGEMHKILAISITCEGWAVKMDKEKIDDVIDSQTGNYKEGFLRPSINPNRVEVLNIIIETYDKTNGIMWEIERKNEVKLINKEDSKWQNKDKNTMIGTFCNLLKDGYTDFLNSLDSELNKNGIQTNN